MPLTLDGDDGISGIDGSAATPAIQGADSNTGITFGTDIVNVVTGGSTRATVDSSGRLLVGTTSARSLGVSGTCQFEGTGAATSRLAITRNANSTTGAYLYLNKTRGTAVGSNTVVQSGDYLGQIRFNGADGTDLASTGAEIACEVDGTPGSNDMPGRLVFSTTADGAYSPTERMIIDRRGQAQFQEGGGASVSFNFGTTSGASSSALAQFRRSATLGSVGTGTEVCRIARDGDLTNTNNSYGSLSDQKLKENIVDANSQWDDIKALQVRNYNFKAETGNPTHTQIGVIAQEAELVSPGLVTELPDIDEAENDLGTTTKTVNYSVLYMKAVKALQEAMTRIEQLETRVAQLEGGAS